MAASNSSAHDSGPSSNTSTNQSHDQHGQSVAKTTPKDALVMASILKEMGVNEYEPRVINQMLEFTYRYVTDVLEDAKIYSAHASKKTIDLDDVKLAIERRLDHSFTSPPPRELLLEIARQKNSQPLPMIGDKSGLRLPPDRYCLTSNNYKLKIATGAAKKLYAQKAMGKEGAQKGQYGGPAGSKPLTSPAGGPIPGGRVLNAPVGGNMTADATAMTPGVQLQGGVKQEVGQDGMFNPMAQGGHTSSVSTISSLPSMEETTASVQQHQFPNLLKRKREDDDDDYDT